LRLETTSEPDKKKSEVYFALRDKKILTEKRSRQVPSLASQTERGAP
jgi:hypothetical protein